MPRTLKCGHIVPSEPDEVLLETSVSCCGEVTYFIRTHKSSIRLTEDMARFVERALFDALPYVVDLETEYGDENPGVLTREGHKEITRLRTLLVEGRGVPIPTFDEFKNSVDEVVKDDPDPAIMRAFNAQREGRRSE